MPLITDEQAVKQESLYPKYDKTNRLILLSNLYKIKFHYLDNVSQSVLCKGKDECGFCEAGKYPAKDEFNYFVNLNGQKGIMNIKPSVFFSLNELEEATGKDKRHVKWLILKSGEKLNTKYTVSKDDNLTAEEIAENEENLLINNEKLGQAMTRREEVLEEKYNQYSQEPGVKEALEGGASTDDMPTETDVKKKSN